MVGTAARADLSKTLPDVPQFKLFASSHSTAAAEVLAFHGVKTGLPQVVLIGGLEGRIYRCDCGKDIHRGIVQPQRAQNSQSKEDTR